MIAGMRKTKIGIVCSVSQTGRKMADNRLLSAAPMPIITPRTKDKSTPAAQICSVTMEDSHRPLTAGSRRPRSITAATPAPPT